MSDKMSTEQFCLRWNDFHSNITSAFSDIRDDDEFLDVTLVCDGDIVRAHKLVLSACSPLFRIMLKKNSHPQPMIFLRGIRFPDMVAILNFMYRGEVNVNQEDLQNFLAAAEELRIKGLSQASNDSKLEKLDNSVPKMKAVSGGSSNGQPPAKKPRESSPGNSPSSTPVSAKSPGPEEEEQEPPQLSVKREFSLAAGGGKRENSEGAVVAVNDEEEDSQQNNLLDCLVQAQNFAIQQAAGNKNFENNINNFPSGHLMQGSTGGQMSSSQNDKGLMQFLGQNNANSAAANAIMMQRLLGTGYELHPLGSRKDNDPLAGVKVARSSKGWHCPQCIHISSTKGNLKSHILSGRHKSYTEKPFGCQYCDRSYGTKQSLQVHISTNHRAERDAEYQALSKSLGMKSFPDSPGYGNYESSLNSFVQNSSSLLHQMQQLQGAGGGGGSVIKFPELSITKHEGRGGGDSAGLQIIQKQNNQKLSADQQDKPSVDIQDQINMLRNMPDFMRINPNTITTEEEDISGDEEEDEDGSPPPAAAEGHKGEEMFSHQAPSLSLHPDASEEQRLRLTNPDVLGGGGGSPAPGGNQNMKFGGLPYEMHRLGGRNEDGLANVVVMKTFRGWHCPHCSYISPSQKGNLKVHILNRHANPGESFGCMFCGKHLSSRSSLQVHISQVHREEQKAKRMIEERLKITNLEDRLKTEMTGGVMGDINTTTEALRLALQQEERLKLDMGSLKNMESLLGSAGMARMLQMMESDAKTFGAGLSTGGGLESGPGSSSGSVPHSPKQSGQSPESSGPGPGQQIRREVELTKVSGEASLQYQRDIGAHHSSLANYRREESEEEVEEMEDGDSDSVYPKDLSSDPMRGHLEPSTLVYPSSPLYSQQHGHPAQSGMTGSD